MSTYVYQILRMKVISNSQNEDLKINCVVVFPTNEMSRFIGFNFVMRLKSNAKYFS